MRISVCAVFGHTKFGFAGLLSSPGGISPFGGVMVPGAAESAASHYWRAGPSGLALASSFRQYRGRGDAFGHIRLAWRDAVEFPAYADWNSAASAIHFSGASYQLSSSARFYTVDDYLLFAY